MKNYVLEGDVLTLTAPEALTSGRGVLVGSIFGIATNAAASGDQVEVQLEGVFDVTKAAAQAWTAGQVIYWDNTAKNFTTTVGSNTKVGVATEAAQSAAVIGRVRLNAAF